MLRINCSGSDGASPTLPSPPCWAVPLTPCGTDATRSSTSHANLLVEPRHLIVDGFHRWRLSQDSKACRARWNGLVPVAWLKVDTATAMAITVRINRAKGSHGALEMAALAHSIINDHGWTRERLADEIGADSTEVDLLLQDGVFTAKGIDRWAYSPSWYPVLKDEVAAAGGTIEEVTVERPDDPADLA